MSSAPSVSQDPTEVARIQQTIRPPEATRLRHGSALLGRNRRREPLSTLGSPALDHGPACLGLHARPETVLAESLDPTRLKSPLHCCGSSAFSRSGISNRLDPGRFRIVSIVSRSILSARPRHTRGGGVSVGRLCRLRRLRLPTLVRPSRVSHASSTACGRTKLPARERGYPPRRGSVNAGFEDIAGVDDIPDGRIQSARVTLPTALASSRSGAGLLSLVSFARSGSTNGETVPDRPVEPILSVSPSLSTTTSIFSNPRRREDR